MDPWALADDLSLTDVWSWDSLMRYFVGNIRIGWDVLQGLFHLQVIVQKFQIGKSAPPGGEMRKTWHQRTSVCGDTSAPFPKGQLTFSSLLTRPHKLLPKLVNSLGKFLLGFIFVTSIQFLKIISIWSYRCSDVT